MPELAPSPGRHGPSAGGEEPHARIEHVQDQSAIVGKVRAHALQRPQLIVDVQVVE
jgi:hypothetical protein